MAGNVERPDQHAAGEQDPIVTSTRNQLGKIVELHGKSVDDPQQLDRLEVRSRRFTVRSSLRTQLTVEILEEPVRRPNRTPIGQDR